jgi:hypothetical protein
MKTALGVLVASMVGLAGRPVAAQAIHVPCKAAIRGQAVACITTPRDGGTVAGPTVRVTLKASGIAIASVARGQAGAAHYHLFLDVDVPPAGEAIPQGPGVTHLGDGQKEFRLENVGAGLHRLIVVLGDNAHVTVARHQSDTTYFTVAMR